MKKLIGVGITLVLLATLLNVLPSNSPTAEARPPIASEVWVDDGYYLGGVNDYHSWGYDAFAKIQDGVNNVSGSIVHVAAGIYYENIYLIDGVELLGAGSASTVIDGLQADTVIEIRNVGNTTRVDGFTVTNGSPLQYGGGMYNWYSSPVIGNCTFRDNTAPTSGGGIYNDHSSPTITNCVFQNNSADYGGGIHNYYSSPTIADCTFTNNSAGTGGGIENNTSSSPIITNCTFFNNSAVGGGGIDCSISSSPTITNCVFRDNRASVMGGGGMSTSGSSNPVITNCTFFNNSASAGDNGGNGIEISSFTTITNCILWDADTDEIRIYSGSPSITYCDVRGGYGGGTNNINLDPAFKDAANGDLHLTAGSPCIDTGNNSAPSMPVKDKDGSVRPLDGDHNGTATADMGAYEHLPCTPPPYGMVSWWKAENNAYDSKGTNNGSAENGATYAAGMVGQAFSFDGSDDYVNVPKSASLDAITTTFTIDAWVYPDAFLDPAPTEYDMGIVVREAATNGYALGTYQNQFAMIICTGTELVLAKSSPASAGSWYHVAGTYNGTHACIYVNGVLVNTSAATLSPNNAIDLTIGTGISRPFDGLIDEVEIFNRALSADEIAAIYNAGSVGKCDWPAPSEVWVDDNYNASSCGGHSWGYNAFDKIQTGIDAVSGSTVHVAAGTYYENIVLKDDVQLLGAGNATTIIDGMRNGAVIAATDVVVPAQVSGFTVTNGSGKDIFGGTYGGGLSLINSNVSLDSCNISSNLAGNDGAGMRMDNSSATVTGCTFYNNSAADDGGGIDVVISSTLNITGCTLFSNSAQANGGGIRVYDGCSLTAVNCTFDNNTANFGGGMYYFNASSTLTNCSFQNNSVHLSGGNGGSGGGIYNQLSPSLTLAGCSFSNNSAEHNGGGMYTALSSPALANCSFLGNSASDLGGGIYVYSNTPNLTNCTFQNNSATTGGGMFNDNSGSPSTPSLTNCSFTNNSASSEGGGICNSGASPTITNCTFTANHAGAYGGGGIYGDAFSSPTVVNCIFDSNTAFGEPWAEGGGIRTVQNTTAVITNCTFYNNSAEDQAGGLVTFNKSTVTNCILWQNSAPASAQIHPADTITVTYSDVEGGYTGTANINLDPLFVSAAGGDLHLSFGSPCIDNGNDSAPSIPATDKDGNGRILDGDGDVTAVVDMGAYEYVFSGYILTYNAGTGGSIAGNTPQVVAIGGDGTQVTAVPDACHHFANWSDGVPNASRTDTNVQANINVTANFASNIYRLTLNASPAAGGIQSAGGNYTCGTVVNIWASANAGYAFSSWSPTGAVAKYWDPVTTVNMTQNRSLTAIYTLLPTPTPTARPTPTPTATPTAVPTPTPTTVPTATPTAVPTPTPTTVPAATPTVVPTPTPTVVSTPTPAATPALTPTGTPAANATPTVTATPTANATPAATPAITATPTSAPTPTPTAEGTLSFTIGSESASMSGDGVLLEDVTVNMEDAQATFQISSGTEILDAAGGPVTGITAELAAAAPSVPDNYYLMQAFDFGPDGTVFSPAIEITLEYDPTQIPEGQTPVIAYYDEDAGEWLFITGTVDSDAGTITFSVEHFTTFAVMGRSATPAGGGFALWIWIVIGFVALTIVVLFVWLLTRRRAAPVRVKSGVTQEDDDF